MNPLSWSEKFPRRFLAFLKYGVVRVFWLARSKEQVSSVNTDTTCSQQVRSMSGSRQLNCNTSLQLVEEESHKHGNAVFYCWFHPFPLYALQSRIISVSNPPQAEESCDNMPPLLDSEYCGTYEIPFWEFHS